MEIILKLVLSWLFCLPFLAMALGESDLSPVYKLLEKGDFYTIGDFQGAKQITLRYAKFGKGRGKNGSLVFINGKGENVLKYVELFYDFYLQGWSPIYTYDHRYQGLSRNVLSHSVDPPVTLSPSGEIKSSDQTIPNPPATYVENYSLYREDMEAFIRVVLNDAEVDRSRLFLIAHSMGGAIALDYLQTHSEKSPFKFVVLSAPMIKVKSNLFPFLEKTSLAVLTGYCSYLPCTWRVPSLRNRFTRKALTNSLSRYAFSEYVEEKWFPQIASRGISFRWVVESFKLTDQLMKKKRIHQIATPFLILQSEKDRLVSNEHHHSFCDRIPDCCHITQIAGKHELFLEKDKPRNEAIETVISFFLNSKKYQKGCRYSKS
ncbi:MAG: alpha/beta hydrolase [Bdellovibrionales bacterium]|nr:alpha/beta hydrolase [Bdellovibrionales bacterium]